MSASNDRDSKIFLPRGRAAKKLIVSKDTGLHFVVRPERLGALDPTDHEAPRGRGFLLVIE